jgi:hypothetical protein
VVNNPPFRVEPRADWLWYAGVPVHRSLVFWMGLCVLAFLAWGWNRSLKRGDDLGFPIGADWIMLRSYEGKVEATRYPILAAKAGLHKLDWSTWGYPNQGASAGWPNFRRTAANPATGLAGSDAGQSPYWFLVACHLPLWLGLTAWRTRRIAGMRKQAA